MFVRHTWKGKKVLVLGLGQFPQGSGIAGALFALRAGAIVRVTDQKNESALRENVAVLQKYPNISFHLGAHRLADIDWADIVIRHQRVRRNAPELVRARMLGKEILSAEGLFFRSCPAPIIGITGTRGKSTTTTLVAEMLKASGKRVWLGGNILISPLTFLDRVRSSDVVVLELSSFQTEALGAESLSPQIACVTNVYVDHLNAYENMEEYAEAKAQIFRHQKKNDTVILNADNPITKPWIREAPGIVRTFSHASLRGQLPSHLLGVHNAMNVAAAMEVAKASGATSAGIKKALANFRGLPHRQEIVAVKKGITFVNDTTATTPDGLRAVIETFAPLYQRLFVILGGQNKNLDFFGIGDVLRRKSVIIALLPGSASLLIEQELIKHAVAYTHVRTLVDAVAVLRAQATRGDAIILSPAAASFGMFANEFDRGETFREIVKKIQ